MFFLEYLFLSLDPYWKLLDFSAIYLTHSVMTILRSWSYQILHDAVLFELIFCHCWITLKLILSWMNSMDWIKFIPPLHSNSIWIFLRTPNHGKYLRLDSEQQFQKIHYQHTKKLHYNYQRPTETPNFPLLFRYFYENIPAIPYSSCLLENKWSLLSLIFFYLFQTGTTK